MPITTPEDRENLKTSAVTAREQGDYAGSLKTFAEVLAWDKEHNNFKGEFDVLGHMRIAYVNWVAVTDDPQQKSDCLNKATLKQQETMDLLEKEFADDTGRRALASAHYADLLIEKMKLNEKGDNSQMASDAMNHVEYSLKYLAGSEAHKA